MPTQNNKDYKESESVILNLEILSAKYDTLLIQYKHAVADYMNFLNNSPDSNKLMNIQGQAFWGTGQAGSQAAYPNISSVNNCSALCLKTPNCTGATYNPTSNGKPMCWLRTGDGNPVPSSKTDYAIVPQAKQLLLNIQNINTQLTQVNNEILNKIQNSNKLYSSQYNERSLKASLLLENYNKLNKERIKMENMVNKYQELDQAQTEGNIKINSNYYSFLLLFALVIVIAIILTKFTVFSGSSGSSGSSNYFQSGGELGEINVYYIIFAIILLAIFIYYYWFIYMYTSGVVSSIATLFSNISM